MQKSLRCRGDDCPAKFACGRFSEALIKPGDTYLENVPYKNGLCSYYFAIIPPKKFKKKR